MLMKEKLVKILAPGVGWKEMAAQNRRRNDTSKHAVGIWEEFSFLDKGSMPMHSRGERSEPEEANGRRQSQICRRLLLSLLFLSLCGASICLGRSSVFERWNPSSRMAIKSFGDILEMPKKRK